MTSRLMVLSGFIQKVEEEPEPEPDPNEPPYGTVEWIDYKGVSEGKLPTPINVSITASLVYQCPHLRWYNFNVFPHKVKMTNTGYTLMISSKWRTERPYLEGGPFIDKHVISQVHFHWGKDMFKGSDHTVDNRNFPAEMQVTFFRAKYMTQQEALRHNDGVTMICYMIRYGVHPDERLEWVVKGIPRVREAKTHTRIGPLPMSQLMPMFYEDYFIYWGCHKTAKGERHVMKWLVPRTSLYASFEQLAEFRKLWDPFDEPNLGNFRPLQERENRTVFFISPHWCQYNSLLPIPRVPEPNISTLSMNYRRNSWMLPPQNLDQQLSNLPIGNLPAGINVTKATLWSSLDPLMFNGYWDNNLKGKLHEDGRTVKFTFVSDVKATVSGGPLKEDYVFDHLHFHFAWDDLTACEHALSVEKYLAECHLVHYKEEYGTLEEAMNHLDGLAIIGLFFDVALEPNPAFDKIAKAIAIIKSSSICTHTNTESLLWMDKEILASNYATYKGSVTIPPYTECITWIIYETPIKIGIDQLIILGKPDESVRSLQPYMRSLAVISMKQMKSKRQF